MIFNSTARRVFEGIAHLLEDCRSGHVIVSKVINCAPVHRPGVGLEGADLDEQVFLAGARAHGVEIGQEIAVWIPDSARSILHWIDYTVVVRVLDVRAQDEHAASKTVVWRADVVYRYCR